MSDNTADKIQNDTKDDIDATQRTILIMGVVISLIGIGLTTGGFVRMESAKKENVQAVGWMIMGIIGIFVLLGGIPMVAVGATKLKT